MLKNSLPKPSAVGSIADISTDRRVPSFCIDNNAYIMMYDPDTLLQTHKIHHNRAKFGLDLTKSLVTSEFRYFLIERLSTSTFELDFVEGKLQRRADSKKKKEDSVRLLR